MGLLQRPRVIAALVAAGVVCFLLAVFTFGLVGHNNDQDWQVIQGVDGSVTVRDEAGWYWKGFSTIWTYPRTLEAFYSSHPEEGGGSSGQDRSISVTFNDAGTAQVSTYVRVSLPVTADQRRILHRDFQGSPENIKDAIRAHLVNCIKASGPIMSASENQASRKAEFNQIVEEQLAQGLFKMRRTEIELSDLTEIEEVGVDAQGNKITREKKARVQATEIVLDKDGKPIVIQVTPLAHYGLGILQFSITETDYDQQTLTQFRAKKDSYLNAERAKAQRQEEVQQRLMIEEKGRRQVAEIQAEENQKKERATIQATLASEVATIDKARAITDGQKRVEIAKQAQQEAETVKATAKIEADTAELRKAATISAAQAKQKEIELAGGVTEKDRVLAEIAAKRDVGISANLKDIQSPAVVIVGGNGEGKSGNSLMENLVNFALLKSTGILRDTAADTGPAVLPPTRR